jgi:hypothetical protein
MLIHSAASSVVPCNDYFAPRGRGDACDENARRRAWLKYGKPDYDADAQVVASMIGQTLSGW